MNLRRDIFQAVADPTRRAILLLLASQAMTAGTIAAHFDSARPTISKHIKVLAECDLIKHNQKGREIHYELNGSNMKEIEQWANNVRILWENRFNKLDNVLDTLKKKKI